MDWNHLKTFLAIAREGTLAGAARKLRVNHSTIFRRLNQFEASLEGRLFERLNEGYQLTDTGERLLQHAESIEDQFNLVQRTFTGERLQPMGKIRITAPANIAYRYLPGYLRSFSKQYTEISYELLVSNQDFSLTRREADIAVRATPSPPPHLVGRKVWEIDWSLFASTKYLNKHSTPQGLSELSDHSLIGGDGEMSQLPAFQWLDKYHPDNQPLRCNDLVAMAALAESGLGLAFLPDDQQRKGLQRLWAFPPGLKSHLWLLTHPDLRQMERIKLLMKHLTHCFQNDPRTQPISE